MPDALSFVSEKLIDSSGDIQTSEGVLFLDQTLELLINTQASIFA
jgi:hypothetical protein